MQPIPHSVLNSMLTASGYMALAQAGVMVNDNGNLRPSFQAVQSADELLGYREALGHFVSGPTADVVCDWMGGAPETTGVNAAMADLGKANPYMYNLCLSKGIGKWGDAGKSLSANVAQSFVKDLKSVAYPVTWVAGQGVDLLQATAKGVTDTLGVLNAILAHLPLVLGVAGGLYAFAMYKRVKGR